MSPAWSWKNIIAAHPKIQDIVVVGIKDSIRDEAIKAFVVLNEGETLSEEEFFRFCEQNMAKFKVTLLSGDQKRSAT